MYEANYNYCM